jgi:hypothetical protein
VILQVAAAVVLAASAAVVIVAWRRHERGREDLPAKLEAERLQRLRAAQFPSTCSWCKSTAIGNQQLVFERHGSNWRVSDLMAQLQTCPDANVDALASILTSEQAAWRRFCAEKCVREFLAAAPISAPVAFVDCAGCGGSYPLSLGHCASCDVSAPVLR